MATAALIAGGLGLMAVSTIQQGRAAEAQGKFEKKIAARNQMALDRQAKAEREAAGFEEKQAARKEKVVKAMQKAASAKSGVSLQGASLAVLTDTAYQFSLERNLILRQGFVRGRELTEQGRIEMAKGRWASSFGKATKRASILSAAGSGLLGAGMLGLKPAATTTTGNGSFGISGTTRYDYTSGGRLTLPR